MGLIRETHPKDREKIQDYNRKYMFKIIKKIKK